MSGEYGQGLRRGPYGSNEGDIWLGGGEVGERVAERGLTLIHEMLVKDGELQEVLYVTEDQELIARATEGTERWIAAQAAAN